MKTIYKYAVPTGGEVIRMPAGAIPLSVQVQHDEPQLWCLVDPKKPEVARTVLTVGTGHSTPDDPGEYVGTWQIAGGLLVFHTFISGEVKR